MPQAILYPAGPGDLTEWTPNGAATNWQAAKGVAGASYVATNLHGSATAMHSDQLPVDAATVSAVVLLWDAAGTTSGAWTFASRLFGVEITGATSYLRCRVRPYSLTLPACPRRASHGPWRPPM